MARKPEAQEPNTEQPADQPGPLDVTAEEALDQMTMDYAQLAQQNALLRVRLGKSNQLIKQLQQELIGSQDGG